MKFHIALIPGDGIGPEIVREARKILDKVAEKYDHNFTYEELLMGGCSIDAYGTSLTDETLERAKASDSVLLGAVGGNVGNSRWYDIDPTVSRAVAELEKAEEYIQVRCADFIIDRLKDIDFNIDMSLDDQFNYIMRRWYDKNIKVSHAMEYLKNAPIDIRKELALDIINFIKEYKDYAKKLSK